MGIEKLFRRLMLRDDKEANEGGGQLMPEEREKPPVLGTDVGFVFGFADLTGVFDFGAGSDDAVLVVPFGGLPFLEAGEVDVASAALAEAGGDEGVLHRVFIIETHVALRDAGRAAWGETTGSGGEAFFGGGGGLFLCEEIVAELTHVFPEVKKVLFCDG